MSHYATKIYRRGAGAETLARGTRDEALALARQVVTSGDAALDCVHVIDYLDGESCVWHRDWSSWQNKDRLWPAPVPPDPLDVI